jgi:virginiamycin A acetyltransferase
MQKITEPLSIYISCSPFSNQVGVLFLKVPTLPQLKERTFFKNYNFKKKGIYSFCPACVSSDITVEPPVHLGNAIVGKNVRIGRHTYINSGILWDDIEVGRYCSISYNVLIGPRHHPTNFLSTWVSFYEQTAYYSDDNDQRRTMIGNDVWIGANVVVRKGIHLEDGAIIGAGAIVIDDVPAYSIVGGVPAHVLKYRFNQPIIKRLLELKWWEMPETFLKQLNFSKVEECIDLLEHMKQENLIVSGFEKKRVV